MNVNFWLNLDKLHATKTIEENAIFIKDIIFISYKSDSLKTWDILWHILENISQSKKSIVIHSTIFVALGLHVNLRY